MHTGTLISDLMATVERVRQESQQQEIVVEQELHAIFAMQLPLMKGDQVLMGAA